METTRNLIKTLPPEILRMSFSFLPNSDLKNVRLVKKVCNAIAASWLWEHLEIELVDTQSRQLDNLIYPYPEAVFSNVTSIRITTRDTNVKRRAHSISNLTGLLGALPRDSLKAFFSHSFRIDRNILALLIRTQTQLTRLGFCSGKRDQDGLPDSMRVRGKLEKLQDIRIRVIGENHNTYKGLEDWFQHTPSLHHLRIVGRLNTPNLFRGWSLPAGAPLLKLRWLVLHNVELLPSTDTMPTLLDLQYLENLDFDGCVSGEHMIRSLAKQYSQAGRCSLRQLSYTADEVSSATRKALEELFSSVDSLNNIILGAVEDSLLDLRSLQRTGACIRSLNIHALDQDQFYSASELEPLIASCPNLELLRLSLANLSAVVDFTVPDEPCDLSSFEGLEESLTVLAWHPTLKILVLTSEPLLSNDQTSMERRWRYAQIAEQIMGHLWKHGSKIHTLSFDPSPDNQECGPEDEDGHTWPRYSFRKGTVTVEIDGKTKVKTIAVPYPPRANGWSWLD